jgi:hypothetical protein
VRAIGIRAVELVPNPCEHEFLRSGMDLFHAAALQVVYGCDLDKFGHSGISSGIYSN